LNVAGTRAFVLGVLVLPDGDAPPLALVELPEGEAPPLALVVVVAEVEVEPGAGELLNVEVDELDCCASGRAVELPVAVAELLECEEPPHPPITRKAARSAENAARRLTFPG
jgi:hypothetical protein